MSEAVIRQRLIRLSCDKLLKAKRVSGGLGRCLQVLTVLKHAHDDSARFVFKYCKKHRNIIGKRGGGGLGLYHMSN